MQVRELLKFIVENCKMDDEVYISDNYGACTNISYIDKTNIHDRANCLFKKSMTLNIDQRLDFRKPENY